MGAVRLVRNLRRPSAETIAANFVVDGAFDLGMFRAAWRRTGATLAQPVATAGGAIAARQATVEAAMHAKRVALEEALSASLRAAEELTRTATRAAHGIAG